MKQFENALVSVIIPSYNAGNYIERCLRNIMGQTYSNLEIIVIDDGSSDDTKQVCELISRQDNRIRYHYQSNSGVSAARNNGIQFATGHWIMFIDADDQIDCRTIRKALEYADKYKADTVCWNCKGIRLDGTEQSFLPFSPAHEFVYEQSEKNKLIKALYYTYDMNKFYPGQMFRAVWGKLLSKDIIDDYNISFPVGVPLGEDAAFLVQYFSFAKREVFVDEPWNLYSILPSSAVGRYRDDFSMLQELEWNRFIYPLDLDQIDKNTVLINYCIECDRQSILNFRKKGNNIILNCYRMYRYIRERKITCVKEVNYLEITKRKRIIAFMIMHKLKLAEAIVSQWFKGI